ncbi:MAG TPA: class I SAM-dependent methyltransferase, partial [Cyclobacteriaceae bacterium]|nr:class I SAM-dependent methyltransferase [Cyclobacteriaceae bacterium]
FSLMRPSNDSEISRLSGLFDYNSSEEIISDLVAVTGLSREEVLKKMIDEYFHTGSNVVADARAAGIDFHIYNSKMEAFYKKTNAFLFELMAVHQSPLCRQIDETIMRYLVSLSNGDKSTIKLLVLGDGIGTDSLRFSRLGFDVTSFEFEGYSSSLARRRFERSGAKIKLIHDLDKIPSNAFNFVVCREVLEHVSDPPAVIASINRYLMNDGYAIITESFTRVEPDFPTHLESNLKYGGKTVSMFIDAGFTFAGKIDDERPFVFRKSTASDNARQASVPGRGIFALAMRKIAYSILRRFE